jgi:sodium transport system permease protein
MTAWRRIGAIARKELLDGARDRRTMVVSALSALLGGPLLLVLMLQFMSAQALRARDVTLPVAGREHATALMAFLEAQQVRLVEAPADYAAQVRTGDLDAVLVVDAGYADAVAHGRPALVRLVYDGSRDRARPVVDQVEGLLRGYDRLWGSQRLMLRGVAPVVAAPLAIEGVDVATPQQSAALLLFMVGLYALFAAVIGAMPAAVDTSAGERERQSLEPLLMTPARPLDIVLGKWLAVCAVGGSVVLLTVTLFHLTLNFAPLPPVGVPFVFGVPELLRFVAVLAPLVLMFGALLLWLAARGRTIKEAQANVSLLMLAVAIVPVLALFLQWREPAWAVAIPVAGQFALMRTALRGEALGALPLALSTAGALAIAILALVAATRLVGREAILRSR